MAAYPPNWTDRVRLVYRNITGTHRATLRCDIDTGAVEATSSLFTYILEALGDYLPSSFAVVGMELIPAGNSVAIPIPTIEPTLDLNPLDITGTQYAGQWRWEGRGFTVTESVYETAKVNFSLQGLMVAPPPSFRYAGSDDARLQAVTEALNDTTGVASQTAYAVNGQKATWYDYTNFNYNSHFERKFRG